jgi:hypothetical protein
MVLSGATDISRFREPLGDDAHVLVLKDGELYEVTDGSVWKHRGLRCIGTGGDLARGFLEGKPVTEQSARAAQRFVAKMRDDCGGGCDFVGGVK